MVDGMGSMRETSRGASAPILVHCELRDQNKIEGMRGKYSKYVQAHADGKGEADLLVNWHQFL
jgi:hypothetical protein